MKKLGKRVLSVVLAGNMLLGGVMTSAASMPVYAAGKKATEEKEKYISDVFIAYAKTEEGARKWLVDNKWEPLAGNCDFNAGKASHGGENVAAVMGIRRTNDPDEAITDMSVMNMGGQYDFNNYDALIEEKNVEINAFIDSFLPAIDEYRVNYLENGSSIGQQRAQIAYEMLNKLKDGGDEEKYPANDTGLGLGDLFLDPLMQEGGDEGSGDLRQILLESSEAAVMTIENAIALAADTEDDTWLQRLPVHTMDYLEENVEVNCPDTAGQQLAPSAVMQVYTLEYGDAADKMAEQWEDIHEIMTWCEAFRDEHDLWQHEGESDDAYMKRSSSILNKMSAEEEKNPDLEESEVKKYADSEVLYEGLGEIEYPGDWGENLRDFFNPAADVDGEYAYLTETYIPFAVALSEGQRCALDVCSLHNMLLIGMTTDDAVDEMGEAFYELLGDEDTISVYTGINRAIFRGGVAMTPETLKDMENGNGLFDWFTPDVSKMVAIVTGAAALVFTAAAVGVFAHARYLRSGTKYGFWSNQLKEWKASGSNALELNAIRKNMKIEANKVHYNTRVAVAKVFICIGAAMLVFSIASGVYALIKQKQEEEASVNRNFSRIPRMIVDENDLVSYKKDKNGVVQRSISFDQYMYYEAVKCNRQEAGALSKRQGGVDKYVSLGCGDVADLNCDHGKEWLALYTAKSPEKGSPILADSLKLVYGTKKGSAPKEAPNTLHYFSGLGAVNIADKAFCFNNAQDKAYINFYWNSEKKAA